MRASLRMLTVVLAVAAGGRIAEAQETDEGWWSRATALVTRSDTGRVAVPRPDDDSGRASTRQRVPDPAPGGRSGPLEKQPDQERRSDATTAPAARGRGAQGDVAVRGGGGGPAFCRSGEGHPVFGWRWCAERGFDRYAPRWERVAWADVLPPWPRRVRESRLEQARLEPILGGVVFGRLRAHARTLGARDALEGRWVRAERDVLVLQVRAGGLPIAELSGRTGRRADVVVINRARR